MELDLLGGSYQQKYKDINSQRTINWYPVMGTEAEANKTPVALFPTPGVEPWVTLPGRHIRGIFLADTVEFSRLFAVCDDVLYEIGRDGTITNRGSLLLLAKGSNPVYMEVNGNNELLITNSNWGYVFDMDTNVLFTIVDPDFFPLTTMDFMDGYFIGNYGGRVYYSEVNSGTQWLGQNVITPTFKADGVRAIRCWREELYIFGKNTTEIYLNDGETPFIRANRTETLIGIVAPHSLAQFENGLMFLGKARNGEAAVYHLDTEYRVQPVSPFSINWSLNNTDGNLEEAWGYIQNTKDGHQWYYLTIPALQTTYVFDTITKQWHERQSKIPHNGVDGTETHSFFRGRHFVNYDGWHLFTDWYSGKIFKETYTNMFEDDQVIIRTRISQTYNQMDSLIDAAELILDVNSGEAATLSGQGSDPQMMLQVSNNGGYLFHPPKNIPMGIQGDYNYRVKALKLGIARNWTVKLSVSDPINVSIQGAWTHGSTGSVK